MFNILFSHKIEFITIYFIYAPQKTGPGTFFQSLSLNSNIMEINVSSGFDAGNDFDFLAP